MQAHAEKGESSPSTVLTLAFQGPCTNLHTQKPACPLPPKSSPQTHQSGLCKNRQQWEHAALGDLRWRGKEVKGSLQHESKLMLWLCTLAKLIYNLAVPEKISSGYYKSGYYNHDWLLYFKESVLYKVFGTLIHNLQTNWGLPTNCFDTTSCFVPALYLKVYKLLNTDICSLWFLSLPVDQKLPVGMPMEGFSILSLALDNRK